MTTKNAQLTKIPELDAFAIALKENGFTVILSQEQTTYFHFFKDGFMGYVQKGYFSGYDYSSTHKPCLEHGTGFGILDNVMELTLENANKCLVKIPGWARNRRNKKLRSDDAVKLYSSAQDYIDSNKWAKYYIL